MNPVRLTLWLLAALLLALPLGCNDSSSDGDGVPLSLRIVHVNDTHSHLDGEDEEFTLTGVDTEVAAGGMARLATLAKQARQAMTKADAEQETGSLVLHAGDSLQGTLYFNTYGGEAEAELMNYIGFDAMVVGNHEFDKGPDGLANFLDMANFPVISANIDASKDAHLAGRIPQYIIKEFGETKVGIFGLTLTGTDYISSPGDGVTFSDEIETAKAMVKKLEDEDVHKIIALTHVGYEKDMEIAAAVDGIDLIVGGHSHSLLGSDTEMEALGRSAIGPYPTMVQSPNGDTVYIVQAYQWEIAVGDVTVEFDGDGEITGINGVAKFLVGNNFMQENADGDMVVVDAATKSAIEAEIAANPIMEIVAEDAAAVTKLAPYKAGVEEFETQVVAYVAEDLWHTRVPYTDKYGVGYDFPNGSLIAPVVCEGMYWKARQIGQDVALSLQNSGGVRTSITKGDLTVAGAIELQPFGNTLYILELTGSEIIAALQNGVTRGSGAFAYVGGARYTVDMNLPDGENIVIVELRQEDGSYTEIDPAATYKIATNVYIANGGDGYDVLENATGERIDTGLIDADVFMEYAEHLGTLYRPEETGVTYYPKQTEATVLAMMIGADVIAKSNLEVVQ